MQGLSTSITGRAIKQNRIGIEAINIRDFSQNKHHKVDDYTYGGGAGMLMQAQPVFDAYEHVAKKLDQNKRKRVIYVTPQGRTFTQQMAKEFAAQDDLIFLCGHYEGIDERVLEEVVTDYVSIGDYVLTGGELAAMVMIDAISRLVPGVLHNEVSAETESFHGHLLEYPQYSRPEVWHGKEVPEVLMTGNQRKIDAWRLEQSVKRTRERRPDLYEKYCQLKNCKEHLMKQKLLHIDMIDMIYRGVAELVLEQEGQYLLRNIETGIYYFANLFDGETSPLTSKVLTCMEPTNYYEDTALMVVHRKEDATWVEKELGMKLICGCFLATYTKKEKASASGLYRPDGKPLANGNAQGLVILPLGMEHCELVMEAHPDTEESYLEEQIVKGQMIGAFIEDRLVGIAGVNDCGDIGLLYVYPQHRRMHIGKALLTYLVNQTLENGQIPYCMFEEGTDDSEAVRKLLESMEMYTAKSEIYWLSKSFSNKKVTHPKDE